MLQANPNTRIFHNDFDHGLFRFLLDHVALDGHFLTVEAKLDRVGQEAEEDLCEAAPIVFVKSLLGFLVDIACNIDVLLSYLRLEQKEGLLHCHLKITSRHLELHAVRLFRVASVVAQITRLAL